MSKTMMEFTEQIDRDREKLEHSYNHMIEMIEALEWYIQVFRDDKEWKINPYFHGYLNGIIGSVAVMRRLEPEFLFAKKAGELIKNG